MTKEDICLDNLQKDEQKSSEGLGLLSCNEEFSSSQYFSLSKKGEIRREFLCAQVKKKDDVPSLVELAACDGSVAQKWRWTKDRLLVHTATNLCLDGKQDSSNLAHVDRCHKDQNSQIWMWENGT